MSSSTQGYGCGLCSTSFHDFQGLESHMDDNHPEKTQKEPQNMDEGREADPGMELEDNHSEGGHHNQLELEGYPGLLTQNRHLMLQPMNMVEIPGHETESDPDVLEEPQVLDQGPLAEADQSLDLDPARKKKEKDKQAWILYKKRHEGKYWFCPRCPGRKMPYEQSGTFKKHLENVHGFSEADMKKSMNEMRANWRKNDLQGDSSLPVAQDQFVPVKIRRPRRKWSDAYCARHKIWTCPDCDQTYCYRSQGCFINHLQRSHEFSKREASEWMNAVKASWGVM